VKGIQSESGDEQNDVDDKACGSGLEFDPLGVEWEEQAVVP